MSHVRVMDGYCAGNQRVLVLTVSLFSFYLDHLRGMSLCDAKAREVIAGSNKYRRKLVQLMA